MSLLKDAQRRRLDERERQLAEARGVLVQAPGEGGFGMGYCEAPDCFRETPARGGRYCEVHFKRLQRGRGLRGPSQARHPHPFARLVAVSLEYANAETDEQFSRARDRLRKAAIAYVRKLSKPQHRMGT